MPDKVRGDLEARLRRGWSSCVVAANLGIDFGEVERARGKVCISVNEYDCRQKKYKKIINKKREAKKRKERGIGKRNVLLIGSVGV